ncbi:MAG: transposase [Candidatus Latescibacteria bacterium]|nr:transposase [Candidatus Latescibacterota bacterium]
MSSACLHAPAYSYQRHEPEQDLLYRVLADHLETFLQRTRTTEHSLPSHVEGELRSYLECGILAYGFLRLRCSECTTSRTVAFSCKGRGFCPSCMGRRMADTARLSDEIVPAVAVRQWVISLPIEIRYRLAYDGRLLSAFLAIFLRVVQAWYRQQARAQGYAEAHCGSVTFVQRFGSALNLNPHFHVLMPDGVYVIRAEGAAPEFVPAPALQDSDVQRIVELAAHRLVRSLQQRIVLDSTEADALAAESPLLSALSSASVQGQLATGPRAGCRVRRLLSDPRAGQRSGRLCFSAWGFSLHAATRLEAEDRLGLERLCRYLLRPPLAGGRLRFIDADHLRFRLKTPWSDGTTHLVLSPLERIEKLAALVTPPRLNLVRYHGVLAPNAGFRRLVVPSRSVLPDTSSAGVSTVSPSRRRLGWAALLARVFAVDVMRRPSCGGRLGLVAVLSDAASIGRYLSGVGLAAAPPAVAAARPPPQRELDLVY